MKFFSACLMLTCLIAPALAQSPDDAIKALVAAINAGSLPGTEAAMTASPTITDEFPPFHWSGKTAAADWMNGFAIDAKAHGVTDDSVTIGKPLHLTVEGLHGYAVVPMTFAYKQNGKPVTENALFTVSLVKTGEKWLISSWTYALK